MKAENVIIRLQVSLVEGTFRNQSRKKEVLIGLWVQIGEQAHISREAHPEPSHPGLPPWPTLSLYQASHEDGPPPLDDWPSLQARMGSAPLLELIDFDLCHYEGEPYHLPGGGPGAPRFWGTVDYLAPEVLEKGVAGYSPASDRW